MGGNLKLGGNRIFAKLPAQLNGRRTLNTAGLGIQLLVVPGQGGHTGLAAQKGASPQARPGFGRRGNTFCTRSAPAWTLADSPACPRLAAPAWPAARGFQTAAWKPTPSTHAAPGGWTRTRAQLPLAWGRHVLWLDCSQVQVKPPDHSVRRGLRDLSPSDTASASTLAAKCEQAAQ